jgi:hypothetical protein
MLGSLLEFVLRHCCCTSIRALEADDRVVSRIGRGGQRTKDFVIISHEVLRSPCEPGTDSEALPSAFAPLLDAVSVDYRDSAR